MDDPRIVAGRDALGAYLHSPSPGSVAEDLAIALEALLDMIDGVPPVEDPGPAGVAQTGGGMISGPYNRGPS